MTRGDIYWADIAPRSGSEQQGRRPAVIVSHNIFNRAASWRSLLVVPVTTSQTQAQRGPTVVRLPAGTGGLGQDSFAICHQVTTLDRSKLSVKIGTLPAPFLHAVEDALKAAMDLP
jgi:mRNA interferase MazF